MSENPEFCTPSPKGGFMDFRPDGNYVRRSDYERLQAEVGRLRAALTAIEKGCSFPEDDVQRAVRDRARQALQTKGTPVYTGIDMAGPDSDRTGYKCLYCGRVFDDPNTQHECVTEKDS